MRRLLITLLSVSTTHTPSLLHFLTSCCRLARGNPKSLTSPPPMTSTRWEGELELDWNVGKKCARLTLSQFEGLTGVLSLLRITPI